MKLLVCTQLIDKNDPILGFFHAWISTFAHHFEHVYVICLKKGESTLPSNVTVFSLGKEEGENRFKYVFRFYTFFGKIFLGQKIDFVFFHMGAVYNILAFPFFIVRKIRHTTFMWWKTHGKIDHLKERIAFILCDVVCTAGSKSFTTMTQKVRVVGHAIDVTHFTYTHQVLESNTLRILSVGRITPIKKIEIAIRALAELQKNEKGIAALHIYGPTTIPSYHDELIALSKEQSVNDCVVFSGARSPEEMRSVYHAYDVLVHPAYEAGFDKVVLEAMASGVIPITSIESFELMLKPFGLYVPPNDVAGYAEALSRIKSMSQRERDTLRDALRTIVVTNHSLATLPERIFGVL